MLLTWLVLGAVTIVAAAAILDTLRRGAPPAATGQTEPSPPAGRLLPAQGALTGELVYTSLAGCRTRSLALATLTLAPPGPSFDCGLWVPRDGEFLAVSVEPALGLRGSRVGLLRPGERELARTVGVVRGEPSWSDEGGRLAWCTEEGETVVLALETGARTDVAGCRPNIVPDGSVLTRPARPFAPTLLRDGIPLLEEDELARGFPAGGGLLDVVGYDARGDGLLAVVAVRFESGRPPRRVLQLWRQGRLEGSIPLPELGLPAGYGRLGERVEFDPTGREVAVAFPGIGKAMIVVELESRRIVFGPVSQHGFAWSPDGAWLAHSTGQEVRLLGPDRQDPVYVLPIGAAAIAWR